MMGLWKQEQYLSEKKQMGCKNDVREIMPFCVICDVRTRWPNPPDIPYMGHKRS